jgi:farnesyl diphosphate synthase
VVISQVACALLLSGEDLNNYGAVENILVEMGIYFQVQVTPILCIENIMSHFSIARMSLLTMNLIVFLQDDYLDCHGDPEFIGKVCCLPIVPISMNILSC